jgi:uncharacterized protein (DUF488 family)
MTEQRSRQVPRRAFTVGHGTLPAEDFSQLLHDAGIASIADVRTVPRSRRNPQFETDAMRVWLPESGIAYAHYKPLGGWRKPRADSPNVALRHPAFRGYADYMLTDEFARAVDELLPKMERQVTAVMCSESVWWRCHRRLLADYLVLVRRWEIRDLMHDGRADPHRLTTGVRLAGDRVIYDEKEEGPAVLPGLES